MSYEHSFDRQTWGRQDHSHKEAYRFSASFEGWLLHRRDKERKGKERIGFSLTTLDGNKSTLASVKIKSPYRVGKYSVDVDSFERVGVESIRKAMLKKQLIIIDEIGKMELFSKKFRELVIQALNTGHVIATIKKGITGYVDEIKSRKDVRLLEVDYQNRDALLSEITKMVANLAD